MTDYDIIIPYLQDLLTSLKEEKGDIIAYIELELSRLISINETIHLSRNK